jgi:hypothetical protein
MRNPLLLTGLTAIVVIFSCKKNNTSTPASDGSPSANVMVVTGDWNMVRTAFSNLKKGSAAPLFSQSGTAETASWNFSPDGRLYIGSAAESLGYKLLDNNRLVLVYKSTSDSMTIIKTSDHQLTLSATKILPNGKSLIESVDLERK